MFNQKHNTNRETFTEENEINSQQKNIKNLQDFRSNYKTN
jgi:hypothetical protein